MNPKTTQKCSNEKYLAVCHTHNVMFYLLNICLDQLACYAVKVVIKLEIRNRKTNTIRMYNQIDLNQVVGSQDGDLSTILVYIMMSQ